MRPAEGEKTGLWIWSVKNKWTVLGKDMDVSSDEARDWTVPLKIKQQQQNQQCRLPWKFSPFIICKEKKQFHKKDKDLWSEM